MNNYNTAGVNKANSRKASINSVGLSILLCANPLSWLIPINNIILIYASLSLLLVVLNNPITLFINKKLWIIVGLFFLFFCSFIFADKNLELFFLYFYSFIAFGVTGILYSSVSFRYDVLFKSIFVIALISMPGIYRTATTDYSGMGDVSGYWMGISQGALRLIMGTFLVLSLLRKRIYKLLTIPIFIVYFTFLLTLGTRGVIFALLLFLVLLYMQRINKLTPSSFLIITFLSIITSIFFIDISRAIMFTLNSYNIEFKALDKIIKMHDLGLDFSNGRNALWQQAFNGFLDSPLYGHGISSYYYKFGQYPHNFYLEMLYEGGILYGLFITVILLLFFKLILSKNASDRQKKLLIFLFCAGVLEVTFSSVYWRNVSFWFFVSYIITLSNLIFKSKVKVIKTLN